MDGWAKLGEVLAGGNTPTDAYYRGAERAVRIEGLLAQAKIKRDEAMQRERFRENAIAAGMDPNEAALLSSAFGAGYNPEQLSGFQLDRQKMGITGDAADAARAGDIALLNNLSTVLSGRPRERTNIAGGVAYDPYAAPDQALQVTPGGAADVAADQALAAERSAGAQENLSQALLYGTQAAAGGWKPSAGKAPPTQAEQEAKIAYILAEGTRLAKDRGEQWAEAWMNEELRKAGMLVEPARGPQFQNVRGGSDTVPAGGDPLLVQAQDAVARGADPGAVRQRLIDLGRADLAEQL